jgi:hypothetical protein
MLARLTAGGTDGNERLTVEAGLLLFVLLAVLGVTILRIGQLLSVHLFLGLLLIGPVVLKLASTGYRFARYYTSNPPYRHKGPPPPYLRLLAPAVVLSTVVVFASGVALLLLGPSSRGSLMLIHKASFFVWLACTALHVLGHLPDLQRFNAGRATRTAALAAVSQARAHAPAAGQATPAGHTTAGSLDAGQPSLAPPPGRAGRGLSLAGALAAGLALALALLPQFGPWLHYHRFLHGH